MTMKNISIVKVFLFLTIGISQNYSPVVEVWSSQTWTYCPYARAAVSIIEETHGAIGIIWAQDINESPGWSNRAGTYGFVSASPYVVYSGVFQTGGGCDTDCMYGIYTDVIEGPSVAGVAVPPISSYTPPMNISMDFLDEGNGNLHVLADVEVLSNYQSSDTKIIFILKAVLNRILSIKHFFQCFCR